MGSALTLEATGHPVGVRGLHNGYGKMKAIWYQKTPNTPPLAHVCVRVHVCVCVRAEGQGLVPQYWLFGGFSGEKGKG